MSNRKVFCVIEQSGYKNTKYVEQHKKQFNNDYSDFYRLNFRYKDDPDAYLYKECSWIDGKNTVYNNVPKIYDYYIFIDDDIVSISLLRTMNNSTTSLFNSVN